ncbi:conjugative transfer protein [Escherichia coli]|nr:conjugative transfer protein [Escherichia coli]
MKQISFFIPLLGTLLLYGCAGTSTEFECNATTSDSRPCDDGADRWSGVVCREIIIPFLARRLFPDVLCLSSGCAGRSGAVTGVVSLAARG